MKTFLSVGDLVSAQAVVLSVDPVINCSVALLTASDRMKTRPLAERCVIRVTRAVAPANAKAIFKITSSISGTQNIDGRVTGLFGVRAIGAKLRFDFGEGFSNEIDCSKSVNVAAYKHFGSVSLFDSILIQLPNPAVGPNPIDIEVGRYWLAPAAAVDAMPAAEWDVAPEWVETQGESRFYQVYGKDQLPSRDRVTLPLTRVTSSEMYVGITGGLSVRDFMRSAPGQEVVVGRGQERTAGSGIFLSTSLDNEPTALVKGRLATGAKRSRQAGHLMQASLTLLEEN
ncbi:MAG: hypothetical protein ACRCV9_08010 [Burkholderiaceae bacterium]